GRENLRVVGDPLLEVEVVIVVGEQQAPPISEHVNQFENGRAIPDGALANEAGNYLEEVAGDTLQVLAQPVVFPLLYGFPLLHGPWPSSCLPATAASTACASRSRRSSTSSWALHSVK